MNLNKIYQNSTTRLVLNKLFADNIIFKDEDSFFFRHLSLKGKIFLPGAILLLVIFIFWYEGASFMPSFLKLSFVPVFALIAALFFVDKKHLNLRKIHLWLVIFLVLSAMSGLMAVFNGIDSKLILEGWTLFALFFITIILAQGATKKEKLLKILLVGTVPLALLGIYQFFAKVQSSGTWLAVTETEVGTRAFAFFGSPNVLAGVLSLSAIISFAMFLKDKNKFFLAVSLLSTFATILTFSRSAWFGMISALIFVAIVKYRKIIYTLPVVLVISFFVAPVRNRLETLFSFTYWHDASLDGRLWALSNGWLIFKENLFFGTGPGSYGGQLAVQNASPIYFQGMQSGYTALYYTDNQFLEILVQTGLFGFLTFLFFCIALIFYLLKRFKANNDIMTLGTTACFICFLVVSFFGNMMEFLAVSLFMAILIGFTLSNEEKNSNSI